VPPQDICVF